MAAEKKTKASFCESNKCMCMLAFLILGCVAAVVLVTIFVKDIRMMVVKDAAPMSWWKSTILYQVYPRSFQDSNSDGIGDLNGIIQHLDHFTDIHVGAICLSPFYKSPMKDFGNDVSDYEAIDYRFGNDSDFDELIKQAHKKDIKVIIDFIPNHVSDQHPWFQTSRANKSNPYRDYFIWRDGQGPNGNQAPNNWKSMFGGSAWEMDTTTQQYYYHNFLTQQPDLNLRHEPVLQELDAVLRFWLDKGVDGFRVDATPHLFEDENVTKDENNPDEHDLTKNQPEIFSVVKRWSQILQSYQGTAGVRERLLICETVDISPADRLKYYEAGCLPFFSDIIPLEQSTCNTSCVLRVIQAGLDIGKNNWPNFVIGNHDNQRISARWTAAMNDAMNILLLTLPGTPTTYYGEEIGMKDVKYSHGELPDLFAKTSNNDANCRSPMQWDNTTNAGFTTATKPWLRVSPDFLGNNVQVENDNTSSTLSIYRRLSSLRQAPAFQTKDIDYLAPEDVRHILSYIRGGHGSGDKYAVLVNLGSESETIVLSTGYTSGLVKVATPSLAEYVDSKINLTNISLDPTEAMVLLLQN